MILLDSNDDIKNIGTEFIASDSSFYNIYLNKPKIEFSYFAMSNFDNDDNLKAYLPNYDFQKEIKSINPQLKITKKEKKINSVLNIIEISFIDINVKVVKLNVTNKNIGCHKLKLDKEGYLYTDIEEKEQTVFLPIL